MRHFFFFPLMVAGIMLFFMDMEHGPASPVYQRSLRVSLDTQKYAGTTLKRNFGDWRGYSAFRFSLYNPDPDPLRITASIQDEEHFRRGGE